MNCVPLIIEKVIEIVCHKKERGQKNFPTSVASAFQCGICARIRGLADFHLSSFEEKMSYFCRPSARVDGHLTIKHTERRKNLSYRQADTTKKVFPAIVRQGNDDPVRSWRPDVYMFCLSAHAKKPQKPVARLAALITLSSWTITCGVLHGLHAWIPYSSSKKKCVLHYP